jgi:sulfur carrier protein
VTSQTSSITLNGEPRIVAAGATIGALLEALDLAGKRVAVERNGSIVPRARHGDTPLAEGDRIEIVVAVGGG